MARCSICHTIIEPGDPVKPCPTCRQEYHESCWDELGGCATYGCEKAVSAQKPPPPRREATGWGDVKTCPQCSAGIGSSVLFCRCGARFPYTDPMSRGEYVSWVQRQSELSATRRTLLLLFIFSLFGAPAPVLGPIAGWYAYSKRDQLAGADGTYLAMGYGTAALGSIYTIVILALVAGM